MSARLFTALLVLACSGPTAAPAAAQEDFARLMNLGKAQFENRNSAKAIESFTAALKMEPNSAAAPRNLARAPLLANQDVEALKLLERARSLEKDSAATSYLAGLACVPRSQFEPAVPFLEEAARQDAFTPALRFQLANACEKAGQHEKATTQLSTTFELRWDRIALFERGPAAEVTQHDLLPSNANLRWRGFSEIKSRAPGHPQTPACERVSQRPPWRTTPQGRCTRYGDVLELVKARDDRLVLVNAGDALTLRFNAKALPPVPRGRVRTFFLYSVGWDEDGEHSVVERDQVEPLPIGAGGDWCVKFNTRWDAG